MKEWEKTAFAEQGTVQLRCRKCKKVIARLSTQAWEFKDTISGKRLDAPSVESCWETARLFRERFSEYGTRRLEPELAELPNLIDYCIEISLQNYAPRRDVNTYPDGEGPFREDHGRPRLPPTGDRLQGRCFGTLPNSAQRCNTSHHFTIEEREELLTGWIKWQRAIFAEKS